MSRLCTLFVFCLLLASPTAAHDFWIEPSDYEPEVGQSVTFTLRIGDHFLGIPYPRTRDHLRQFVAHDASGIRPVVGRYGATPAGGIEVAEQGTMVVGYRSTRTSVSLGADAFESYLREVGLERIIQLRAVRGESAKEGREAYSRCAKTILSTGTTPDAGYKRLLGLDLELVPEQSPRGGLQARTLTVRALFHGKPVVGIKVAAIHEDAFDAQTSDITDADGRASLSIGQPGAWIVTAVHMIPAPDDVDADWESFWASLTFRRPQHKPLEPDPSHAARHTENKAPTSLQLDAMKSSRFIP